MKGYYYERDEDDLGWLIRNPENHCIAECPDDLSHPKAHAILICKLLNEDRRKNKGRRERFSATA